MKGIGQMGTKISPQADKRKLFEKIDKTKAVPAAIFFTLVAILSFANDQFLQIATFRNLFQSVAPVGIVAIGAMCVIITGGIDFTAGYGLATAGVAAGVLYVKTGYSLAVLIVAGIVIGILVGYSNGIIITKLKVSPFITTLAMMSVLQGMTLLISSGQRLLINDPAALWLGQGMIFGSLPVSFVLFLVISFIGSILLNKTKFGVYVYAMGGNEDSAVYAGVNINKYKIMVYAFAGFCTGVASVVTISRVALISPNISGSILMDGIASTIIGGTSVSGGKGTVTGTILGVLIMGLISTLLTYLNVDSLLRDVVKGGIIITALLIDVVVNKAASKAKLAS
jgi:ribose/xylose/arabinose/galactoside ABC-type transport system permease subunit